MTPWRVLPTFFLATRRHGGFWPTKHAKSGRLFSGGLKGRQITKDKVGGIRLSNWNTPLEYPRSYQIADCYDERAPTCPRITAERAIYIPSERFSLRVAFLRKSRYLK